jgi:hypothetical protein
MKMINPTVYKKTFKQDGDTKIQIIKIESEKTPLMPVGSAKLLEFSPTQMEPSQNTQQEMPEDELPSFNLPAQLSEIDTISYNLVVSDKNLMKKVLHFLPLIDRIKTRQCSKYLKQCVDEYNYHIIKNNFDLLKVKVKKNLNLEKKGDFQDCLKFLDNKNPCKCSKGTCACNIPLNFFIIFIIFIIFFIFI